MRIGPLARIARFAELDDQVEACRRVFTSDTRWIVVRGSDLEEGESQGLPVWSRHVGDPSLESNITRRVDFALFMVEAIENDDLVREAQLQDSLCARVCDRQMSSRNFLHSRLLGRSPNERSSRQLACHLTTGCSGRSAARPAAEPER